MCRDRGLRVVPAEGQVSCWEVPQAGAAEQDVRKAPQLPVYLPPTPLLFPQLLYKPAGIKLALLGSPV